MKILLLTVAALLFSLLPWGQGICGAAFSAADSLGQPPSEGALEFRSEEELRQFLCGEWVYSNPGWCEDMAWLTIEPGGVYSLVARNASNRAMSFAVGSYGVLDYTVDENGVPNVISLRPEYMEDQEQEPIPYAQGISEDYALIFRSLCDGEMIMELYQISNGRTLMSDSLFDLQGFSPAYVFRKKTDLLPVGEIKRQAEFYAICCKQDTRQDIIWLDEVDYDPATKKVRSMGLREALPYRTHQDIQSASADGAVSYPGVLYHVKTDEQGMVESFGFIEYDKSPWGKRG